ncbi:uncharacterized protein [Antedon mediterranea]|uniref:uncharacterized protein n=1 Tax=Antedon mediterranea TaxID=105859 RepID=UPI003AF621B0
MDMDDCQPDEGLTIYHVKYSNNDTKECTTVDLQAKELILMNHVSGRRLLKLPYKNISSIYSQEAELVIHYGVGADQQQMVLTTNYSEFIFSHITKKKFGDQHVDICKSWGFTTDMKVSQYIPNNEKPKLTENYNNLESKYQQLESQNKDVESQCKDLENQNKVLESQMKDLETQNRDLEDQKNILESLRRDLKTQNEDLTKQNNTLATQICELKSQNEDLESRKTSTVWKDSVEANQKELNISMNTKSIKPRPSFKQMKRIKDDEYENVVPLQSSLKEEKGSVYVAMVPTKEHQAEKTKEKPAQIVKSKASQHTNLHFNVIIRKNTFKQSCVSGECTLTLYEEQLVFSNADEEWEYEYIESHCFSENNTITFTCLENAPNGPGTIIFDSDAAENIHRTLLRLKDTYYVVMTTENEIAARLGCTDGEYKLILHNEYLKLYTLTDIPCQYWHFRNIRSFGVLEGGFFILCGRGSSTGPGRVSFLTEMGKIIFEKINRNVKNLAKKKLSEKEKREADPAVAQKN